MLKIWRQVIKGTVPEMDDVKLRSVAIKGLKSIIMIDDYSLGVVPQKPLKLENGFYDKVAVQEFVVSNWQQVGKLGIALERKRAAEPMEA